MIRLARAAAIGAALATGSLVVTAGQLFAVPLPTIDGTYRLLGLDERAYVVRDALGIPRIRAGTEHDLWFMQGYVTAQDRLVQMERMRAASPPADVPASEREAYAAYAEGVTKLISQLGAARALPGELLLSGRLPSEWKASDVAAIARAYLPRMWNPCTAVAGDATRRGRPLLAADLFPVAPEPGWYEIGLQQGELRAVGISLPGVPGIVAGHNGWAAWAMSAADAPAVMLRALEIRTVRAVGSTCAADINGSVTVHTDVPVGGLDVESLRLQLSLSRRASGARIVVDLGEADASRSAVSSGASGLRFSPHFTEQAALWEAGQLHRLPFTSRAIGRVEGELTFRPR